MTPSPANTASVVPNYAPIPTDWVNICRIISSASKNFTAARAAHPDKYFNLKSECAYKLAEFINDGKLRINCPEELQDTIAEEIETCLVALDVDADTSRKRIIDKHEQKSILGRSPDYFDPLLMGMSYYITPQPKGAKIRLGSTKQY